MAGDQSGEIVDRFVRNADKVVDAVERSLVAVATAGGAGEFGGLAVVADRLGASVVDPAVALCSMACHYAIASRFLAVGTPRSIAVVSNAETILVNRSGVPLASLAMVAAMRVYFPVAMAAELRFRFRSEDHAAASYSHFAIAAASQGRDPLTADIVNFVDDLTSLRPRRGAHFNVPAWRGHLDESWLVAANAGLSLAGASTSLPRMAAGLDDGRQADEVSVFCLMA